MNFGDTMARLRAHHAPRGTGDVVLVRPENTGVGLQYATDEIEQMLECFERKAIRRMRFNPLEQMAIRLLLDGAGLDGSGNVKKKAADDEK